MRDCMRGKESRFEREGEREKAVRTKIMSTPVTGKVPRSFSSLKGQGSQCCRLENSFGGCVGQGNEYPSPLGAVTLAGPI